MFPSLRLTPANRVALQASKGRVVVIGPSGWLGSAALAMLDCAFADDAIEWRALVFGSHARQIRLPSGREISCRALDELPLVDVTNSIILHFGYLTKDKIAVMSADDYVRANDAIQEQVVHALAAWRPRGLFFASSGAVYQLVSALDGKPSKERNLYGWMKVKHENDLAEAAAAAGPAFINGRIFSLAGEFLNKVELYALGSFLAALRANEPIRLQASREVWRSYTYVGDVINLAMALMFKEEGVPCFDIAGAEAIEVGDLAALCAKVTGKTETKILRPVLTSDPPDRMIGNHTLYYKLLEQEGLKPLPLYEQIRATAIFLNAH